MTAPSSDSELDSILEQLLWGEHDDERLAISKAKAALLAWNERRVKSTLQAIADKNYAEDFGTYDFDGIAEGVLDKLNRAESQGDE